MKEPNLGLLATDLLFAATALAGILDQPLEGNCVTVNYRYVTELIRDVQISAKLAANELLLMQYEKGGEQ